MCHICDRIMDDEPRVPRRSFPVFWSEAWVLLELKAGMLASRPDPEAITVPFVIEPKPESRFLDIDEALYELGRETGRLMMTNPFRSVTK